MTDIDCTVADSVMTEFRQLLYDRAVDGDVLAALADLEFDLGHWGNAATLYRYAVQAGTTEEIFDRLARATFPGDDYRTHLASIHAALRPETYLEIGVFDGDTLALAQPPTHAIGVDPAPRPASMRRYAAPTTIHAMTSDDFFRHVADGAITLGTGIDLAFIDGLHHFDQVLHDFISVERHCHARSVILLHDTMPVAAAPASRAMLTRYWCGDVWPIVSCLRKYRPDLTIVTIPTYPSGLTIVMGLDPSSTVLADCSAEAIDAFMVSNPRESSEGPWRDIAAACNHTINQPAAALNAIQTWMDTATNTPRSR
ncbi:MAG: class I SAM-dependent methyltransferase [Acidiphilium sp.]